MFITDQFYQATVIATTTTMMMMTQNSKNKILMPFWKISKKNSLACHLPRLKFHIQELSPLS